MNLSHKSLANVKELQELLGETNRTRVISSSLEVTKHIFRQLKSGKRIIIRDKHGKDLEMFFTGI